MSTFTTSTQLFPGVKQTRLDDLMNVNLTNIQRSDKGSGIVISNTNMYIEKKCIACWITENYPLSVKLK